MSDPLAAYMSGSSEPWTASVLAALVRLRRPSRILELGTFEARTTRALAAAAPEAEIMTVDLERRFEGDLPANVTFHESDALDFLRASRGRPFDFVFVDDDHTYSHVRAEVDLLMYKSRFLTRKGSLIVLHDVIGPFGLGEIISDWGGFIIDLPLLHAAGGLGVIEVGG